MLTDFNNIWSWGNLQPHDLFRSYYIQFVYEYYKIEKKTRDILYAFNAAASFCRRASFLQLFP